MSLSVNDIFIQKLNEIQSRIPLRIRGLKQNIPFQELLDNTAAANAIDKEAGTRDSNIKRATISRAKSSASIPADKNRLMEMINDNIQIASKKYGVDADLIKAVIKQESGFNPYSLSRAGAQGLMQIMPDTADALKLEDPWDIAQNIDGGTKYLRDQLFTFDGSIEFALAAYNAGPQNVYKYKGIPPFAETQDYVARVLQFYRQYSAEKD